MAPGTKRSLPAHVRASQSRNANATGPSKRVRGKNRGLAADIAFAANNNNKLVVIIPKEINAPIGVHATKFATSLGVLIRHMAPVKDVNVWTDIDSVTQEIIIAAVRNKFEIVDYDNESEGHVKIGVHRKCYELYKGWRSRMKSHYLGLLEYGLDPYKYPYPETCEIKWKHMVDVVWPSEEHQKIAAKNKENKSKQKYGHTMGSKSFPKAMSEDPDNTFGNFWEKSRKRKGTNNWIEPICGEIHDQIISLEKKSSEEGATPLSKEEISQQVFGQKSGYLIGFGVGPKPRASASCVAARAHNAEVQEELTMLREKTSSQAEQIKSQAEQITFQANKIDELFGMFDALREERNTPIASNTGGSGFMNILMDD